MDFQDFARKFPKALEKSIKELKSKENMNDLGKVLSEEIELRTRLGKGVNKSEGKVQKLRPLKPSTILARKRMKKTGELGAKTSPSRSNLTAVGIMLNSIEHKAKKGFVEIGIPDVDYAQYAHEARPFMHLSKKQVKKTITRLQDILVKMITKILR